MTTTDLSYHKPSACDPFVFGRVTLNCGVEIIINQEFDDLGNHRLVATENGKFYHSEWKSYRGLSVLTVNGIGIYVGVTEYYTGELPRVFQLVRSLTESMS